MLTGLGYRFVTEGYGYPTAFTPAWSNMCTAGAHTLLQCTVSPAALSPVLQVWQTPVRPNPFAQVRRRLRQARHPVRLLGRHGGLLQISGVGDADRSISFERALESQLFCPFAYLRKHLLAEQTDAVHGILMRNVPIVAPDRHDAWARFFQQVTNARQHLLRRPAQDHAIRTLFFERRIATRILGAAYRELNEIAPPAGREIA